MRINLRRPRYQRHLRVLLAFALILPAAGTAQAAGPNPVSWTLTAALSALAGVCVYDAYRRVAVITRHGVGIVGTIGGSIVGGSTAWLAWGEITRIQADGHVVSLTVRTDTIYQVQLDQRAAALVARMVERRITGRARL